MTHTDEEKKKDEFSQNVLIASYLKTYGSITVRQARKPPICCERLAARISDLRKAGILIETERHQKKSSVTGKMVPYVIYKLQEE